MKNLSLVIILNLMFFTSVYGQDYSSEAKSHFSKYLNTKAQVELISNCLPSIYDCKLVFKGINAFTYFGYIEDMKSKLSELEKINNKTFVDCRIESFTTYDIRNGKGNYAGGMEKIKDKLQHNVTFYRVTYLKEKDAEFGTSYKYCLLYTSPSPRDS